MEKTVAQPISIEKKHNTPGWRKNKHATVDLDEEKV
jgi:hypothetical protein